MKGRTHGMNESIKKTRGVIESQPPIIPHPPLFRSVFSRRLQLRLSNGSIVLGEKSIKIEQDWDLILDRTDPRVGSETITHILDNHHSSTPSTRYVCQFSVTFFFPGPGFLIKFCIKTYKKYGKAYKKYGKTYRCIRYKVPRGPRGMY